MRVDEMDKKKDPGTTGTLEDVDRFVDGPIREVAILFSELEEIARVEVGEDLKPPVKTELRREVRTGDNGFRLSISKP